MSDFMNQVLNTVVIPLLPVLQALMAALIGLVIYKIQQKTKNDNIDHYLTILQDLVIRVVGEINQTTVETLKALQGGKLTDEQKAYYFNLARDRIMIQLTEAQEKTLGQVYNDLDAYINALIESTVSMLKPQA